MKADNHNEGGIFALYSLVRNCGRWLIMPAMIGGAALLADGILTPAVTVTSAIEGLRTIDAVHRIIGDNQSIVVIIVIAILCGLFIVQRAGTSTIGKGFGPIMTLWFAFLAVTGFVSLLNYPAVLLALNPLRGIGFLFNSNLNNAGIMVLGNVFLCTTGAEALYSDMGHVGKANIYVSWPFVKAALIINYLGQGAWIVANNTDSQLAAIPDLNPFFQMLPEGMRIFAVVLSAFAAIIASQALITGSFSIISEAIRLDLMPHMKINYPSENKGQLYIPLVNNILWAGCIFVVLLFRSSEHMEAAYGLAITVTMLMTTLLLFTYLSKIRKRGPLAVVFLVLFVAIEAMFFVSSLTKFFHGGYVTVLLALSIFMVMYVWRRGTAVERTQSVYLSVHEYLDQLYMLSHDDDLPYTADNLVFLTNDSSLERLDRDILYSILNKRPKRARAYWFLNVQVTDEPYTHEFSVNDFGTNFVYKVQLRLGFRVNQRINEYMYQIVQTMVEQGRLVPQQHRYSIYRQASPVGDFKFCMIRKVPSASNDISERDRSVIQAKYAIRRVCGSPTEWYGLENSSLLYEYVPLFARSKRQHKLAYVELPKDVAARNQRVEEEEDDFFSVTMRDAHDYEEAAVHASVIGGHTASFRPFRKNEE